LFIFDFKYKIIFEKSNIYKPVLPFIHPIKEKTLKVLNLKGLISRFAVWTGIKPMHFIVITN
jgi:hypothetical protein